MENLEIYEKYRNVPNEALKPFDNGNFKGTDINTMWRIKSLTEQFGMCGVGWYYDIVRTWNECIDIEQGGDILTFAEIKLYFKNGEEWSKGISGVGGNKMLTYVKSKDYYKASDEAIKMAVTDALGNACRNLGFGADIYWANDKTKYTNEEQVKEPLNEALVKEFVELGGTLEIAADYYKTSIDNLQNEQIKALVDAKKKNLAKAKQNA